MFIIDLPYVSDLLRQTLLSNQFPVLKTPDAVMLLPKEGIHFISEKEAIEKYKTGEIPTIYTSSENSIGWIAKNLSFSELPEKVELFKNKLKFRMQVSALYPDFYFREVDPDKIEDIEYGELPKPFIIKPNVGFFSLGVHQVSSPESWEKVKIKIREEAEVIQDTYPKEVLDTAKFIIEEIIEGEEYTIFRERPIPATGCTPLLQKYSVKTWTGSWISSGNWGIWWVLKISQSILKFGLTTVAELCPSKETRCAMADGARQPNLPVTPLGLTLTNM